MSEDTGPVIDPRTVELGELTAKLLKFARQHGIPLRLEIDVRPLDHTLRLTVENPQGSKIPLPEERERLIAEEAIQRYIEQYRTPAK